MKNRLPFEMELKIKYIDMASWQCTHFSNFKIELKIEYIDIQTNQKQSNVDKSLLKVSKICWITFLFVMIVTVLASTIIF